MRVCDFCACGRAVYDYVNDCWQPMPQLENLSGFDRDTRSFAEQRTTSAKAIRCPRNLKRYAYRSNHLNLPEKLLALA